MCLLAVFATLAFSCEAPPAPPFEDPRQHIPFDQRMKEVEAKLIELVRTNAHKSCPRTVFPRNATPEMLMEGSAEADMIAVLSVNLLRKREDGTIESTVSQDLLHFSVSTIDKRAEFRALGLKETWGESNNFEQHTNQELQKYVSNQDPYDPLTVCCAIRRKVERLIYESLSTPEHKTQFLAIHLTRKKLAYAESVGATVPEHYYLLGIIYNDGMHWRENADNISPIAAKLENLTIRHMIKQLP